MNQKSEEEWTTWNHQGLFPGPDESEPEYMKRVVYCENIKQILSEKVGAELPFDLTDQTTIELLKEAFPKTADLYDIEPSWVLLFCNNYQLSPWHGGCAWIFQLDESSPTSAFLQIRSQFRISPYFLGKLYRRSELIAHELSHIGRMVYQEPQFEEIFAYQSSHSKWRRWLGPIVQSSKETLFFILLLSLVVMADFALLFIGQNPMTASAIWILKGIPAVLILLALGRLYLRHRTYQQALRNLEEIYGSAAKAKHLLYRLRDKEIKQIAHSSVEQARLFLDEAPNKSFQWRFLMTVYPII